MDAAARKVEAVHTLVLLAARGAGALPVAWREARMCLSTSCSLLAQHVRHATVCISADVAALQGRSVGFVNPSKMYCWSGVQRPACSASAVCRLGARLLDSRELCLRIMNGHTVTASS